MIAAATPSTRPGIGLHRLAGLDAIPCGLRPMRQLSAAGLFAAALLAVWVPLLVTGPGWPAVILDAVVGVYFLGVASNCAVLLWLTRGPAPLEHQPPTPGAIARLLGLSLIPAALPVLARRP